MRNAVAFWITPWCSRESAAMRNVAPRGMMSRASPVPAPRQLVMNTAATTAAATNAVARRHGRLALLRCARRVIGPADGCHRGQLVHAQRLLQQHGGGERIYVGFAIGGAPARLTDTAQRRRCRISLVEEGDGKRGASCELCRHTSAFQRARGVVAFTVEG